MVGNLLCHTWFGPHSLTRPECLHMKTLNFRDAIKIGIYQISVRSTGAYLFWMWDCTPEEPF